MDVIDLTEEEDISLPISGQEQVVPEFQDVTLKDYLKLDEIFCDASWNESERLSLEYVKQILTEETIWDSIPSQQHNNKRKRDDNVVEEDIIIYESEERVRDKSDDELIAKLLQAEYDEEEEERKKKTRLIDEEDESVLHHENRDAIEYVCQSVIRTNDSDRQSVMEKLKCTESQLDIMISYLVACPKIIHFHPDRVLKFFVQDDQYRNQFETKTSSGTLSAPSRISWERNLFGGSYSDHSTGIRPKYGVLMYNGYDLHGCPSARTHYGDSYLVLQNVEDRVTYCYGDSGGHGSRTNATDVLGYGCWLARILNAMPLTELQFLYRISHPSYVPCEDMIRSDRLSCYIEIQVHGSVLFRRDISMLCLASRWKSDPTISQLAEQFCQQNPRIFLNYIDN